MHAVSSVFLESRMPCPSSLVLTLLLPYVHSAYDVHIPEFSYGPAVDGLNLACLILLILGSEVYHRVILQESSFETEYPPIELFYAEE